MKRLIITLLTVLLVILSYTSTVVSSNHLINYKGSDSQKWAVLITVGEPKLDDKDTGKLRDILTNNGWPEGNIYQLRENQATKEEILNVYSWLNNQGVKEGDLVLFYFSMHGGRTADVYPFDELDKPEPLDEFVVAYNQDRILDDELAPMFDAIQTQKLVIIFESCYSGGMLDGTNDLKQNQTGRIVITSTDVNETSYSYSSLFFSKKGYLLIHYLMEGLKGAAEKNNDGYISVEEAYEYAKVYTIKKSTIYAYKLFIFHRTLKNHIQHPQIYDAWPSQENNQEELKLIAIS